MASSSRSLKKVKEVSLKREEYPITPLNFNVKFNKTLKGAIHELFTEYVDAAILVHIFRKYSKTVLVDKDIEIVKRKAENKGNKEANEELLERLVKYKDWFPCLIQCLRDQNVNQCHLADQLKEIEAFVQNELNRDLKNHEFQESPPCIPAVEPCAQETSERLKLLEKYHSLLFEKANFYDDHHELSPCYIEHLLKASVSRLTALSGDSYILRTLMQLLGVVKLHRNVVNTFEGVIISLDLPGAILSLCTPIRKSKSQNIAKRRLRLRVKKAAFEILTYLSWSSKDLCSNIMTKEFFDAMENVFSGELTFAQANETDEEIICAPVNIKRDLLLILSAFANNKDCLEELIIKPQLRQILLQCLGEKDKFIYDIALLLLVYTHENFIQFAKDYKINLEDMLESFLSHLRFYVTYNIQNRKAKIQAQAYLEGMAKLALLEKVKETMKKREFLEKIRSVVSEVSDDKFNTAYVHFLINLGTTKTDDETVEKKIAIKEKRQQKGKLGLLFRKSQEISPYVSSPDVLQSMTTGQIESQLRTICGKLSLVGKLNLHQICEDLDCLLKIFIVHGNSILAFQKTLMSTNLPDTLIEFCAKHLPSMEVSSLTLLCKLITLDICMKLIDLSPTFSDALAKTSFILVLVHTMQEKIIDLKNKTFSEVQDVSSLILLNLMSKRKENQKLLKNLDVALALSNAVNSGNILVLVAAKVLLFSHNEQVDVIKILIGWLKEAMNSEKYKTARGAHARTILFCLSQLAVNSGNKNMIKEERSIRGLHRQFHTEMDQSITFYYITLINKLELINAAEKCYSQEKPVAQEISLSAAAKLSSSEENSQIQMTEHNLTGEDPNSHEEQGITEFSLSAPARVNSFEQNSLHIDPAEPNDEGQFVDSDLLEECTSDWLVILDRRDSEKILVRPCYSEGTFMVRKCEDTCHYTLSVLDTEHQVKHYLICKNHRESYFIFPEHKFKTVQDMVQYYSENTDTRLCRLSKPFKKAKSIRLFEDSEISKEAIQLTEEIAKGSTAKVWKGKIGKYVDVAVKILNSNSLIADEFLNEAQILYKLEDQRIIQFLGYVQTEESVYIVTELMPNGTLLDFFKTNEGKALKLKDIISIDIQIVEAMNFLDYKNIVHTDLRAANVLVGYECKIKISDFGSAFIVENGSAPITRKGFFKIKWTAPEAVIDKQFSIKSDVWSFGVVMYETVTLGKEPYPNSAVLKMVQEGNRMLKPDCHFELPHSYYNTMILCWKQSPENRPTFDYLLNYLHGLANSQ